MQAPRFRRADVRVGHSYRSDDAARRLGPSVLPGHDAYGYGVAINQDCCTSTTWDAGQWQFRNFATPTLSHDLIATILSPKEVSLADHPSWTTRAVTDSCHTSALFATARTPRHGVHGTTSWWRSRRMELPERMRRSGASRTTDPTFATISTPPRRTSAYDRDPTSPLTADGCSSPRTGRRPSARIRR